MAWWYGTKSSGGVYAIVVADTTPNGTSHWHPATVQAIFEFGSQKSG